MVCSLSKKKKNVLIKMLNEAAKESMPNVYPQAKKELT